MTAYNVVRFRVKPGREEDFVEAHRRADASWPGLRKASIMKTGDRSWCFVGEWDSAEALRANMSGMVAVLDSFRDTLEDLGNGRGLTDPISGEVVLEMRAR